ncbi:MAG: protein kinase [Acidobacteriia bacterium]|nr:protein kinase [Terriglobia bacterium]
MKSGDCGVLQRDKVETEAGWIPKAMRLKSGSLLGNFEILAPLGAGGMGEVYRARDLKLDREVAVKVLPAEFASDQSRLSRFEREAKLLAALNHPNIASIYDLKETDGIRYLVLEYIPGETLSKKISTGLVPLQTAVQWAGQILEALAAAHERGVMHRDLKPPNIMVTPDGRVKVLDFGLAKELPAIATKNYSDESPTIVQEKTAPGTMLGTTAYMSPEQVRGKPADERTDIWAFGCILFELLTGHKAFEGETVSDKLAAVLTRDPDWKRVPSSTPSSLQVLLHRCLEKDVEKRLSHIAEARLALSPMAVSVTKPRPFLSRLVPGRANWKYAVGALVLILLIGFAAYFVEARLASRSLIPGKKYLVVLPFKDLSGEAADQLVGDGMVETLSSRLGRLPDIQVIMPSAAVAAFDRGDDPFRVAQSLGANLMIRGSVQKGQNQIRIAFSLWNTEKHSEIAGDTLDGSTSELFGMQDLLAEKVIDALRLGHASAAPASASGLQTADEQERYLRALGGLQRYDKESSIDEAMNLLRALAQQKPEVAIVQAALGRAYLYKFNLTRQRQWIDEAVEASTRAQQLDSNLPEVAVTLGDVLSRTGRGGEAITAYNRALAIQPNNYGAWLGLAGAYNATGNTSQAEASYRRAIELQPSYWGGYSKLGGFYFVHGNYSKAVEMFQHVTERSPDNARALGNLGASYQLMNEFSSALTAYRKSLALAPTAMTYSNIGTLEYFTGHFQQAAEAFEAAVRLMPDHFELWANLGDAYRWSPGLSAKAAEAYAKAIGLCEGELRINPKAALVHSTMALCLVKTGNLVAAEDHAQKALSLEPRNPELLYNAALVANIGHKTRDALSWIQLAVQNGYSTAFCVRDPELENLRNEEAFKRAVQESKP